LVAPHPEDIDYWEIDPDWDRQVFRSAVQAIRPRKRDVISDHLVIQALASNSPICVRIVDIHGMRGWIKS
jgi:hypothetical protein